RCGYGNFDGIVCFDNSDCEGGYCSPFPPTPLCTPPPCPPGDEYYCPGHCPGGCGTICVTPGPTVAVPPADLVAGSAAGAPGDRVRLDVSLNVSPGTDVAGVQDDMLFDLDTAVAANADGTPDCTVNPEIHKSGTTFVFQPVGCQPGSDCK